MANAAELEPGAGSITFELDRFAPGDRRLEVTGRWYGVRGRRFVRPALVVLTSDEQFRLLADLEHKPWPAEEGDLWQAAFPWDGAEPVLEAELTVAPDITISLPAPGTRVARAAARRSTGRAGRPPARVAARARDSEPQLREQLTAARREIEQLRAELENLRERLTSADDAAAESSSRLEAAQIETRSALARRDAALADLEQADAARNQAEAGREQAEAAREQAETARNEADAARAQAITSSDAAALEHRRVAAEHERALADRDQTAGDLAAVQQALEQARGERDQAIASSRLLETQLATLQQTGQRLQLERDEAISARGAALVMRNATRANAIGQRHWPQRTLAFVLFACVVVVLLIVLHVV